MKNFLSRKIILILLAFFFCNYFIRHPGNDDLTKPEIYCPSQSGTRPGPGNPMKPVTIYLDQSLSYPWWNLLLVKQAISSWSNVSGSTARINYGGEISHTDDWSERLGDKLNSIELVRNNWIFGPYIVALTILDFNSTTGEIREADVLMNGVNFSFGDITIVDADADLGNILTHELGHLLGLGHSQVRLSTMSESTGLAETRRRSLHQDDREAVQWLYPSEVSDLPAPSLWRLKAETCGTSWNYESGPEILEQSAEAQSFCLYGAGFRELFTLRIISERTKSEINDAILNFSFSSENLMSLELDMSQLPPDSYQMEMEIEDSKVGFMRQALLVKEIGNELPLAYIYPASVRIKPGEELMLYGTGSSDPEGSPLSYHWFLIDGATSLGLEGETGATVLFNPPVSGDYLIGLMVDDGVNYSEIAESLIEVSEPMGDSELGCGCQLTRSANLENLAFSCLPVLFWFLWRLRRVFQGRF